MDIKSRIEELVGLLNKASDAYYNGQGEIMSDHEWDALFDELKAAEEKTGYILPDSPTQNVSADTEVSGEKEEHEFAALSLAKTKSVDELIKWADGRPAWISWKLDGLTLVATYDEGRLTHLVTRGDGHTGTNILRLANAIYGLPEEIKHKGHLVIRGEAVISYEDFNNFLLETGEDYANPRNLASGSLSLKDPEEVKRRKINWIPFTLVYIGEEIKSLGERFGFLRRSGFEPVEMKKCETPEDIRNTVEYFTEKVESGKMQYPVDGLVIAYDDTEYAATGSVTGHHATRAGLAFKWKDESAFTSLERIEWSCAYSAITPVAVFETVSLEGTKVSRASLCNLSECKRLGIGGRGTVIEVIKANKIIPKVISVKEKAGELEVPGKCPVCGGEAVAVKSASGTETLHCDNPLCSAKKIKKFSRFVSKKGVDIDGLSEQTVAKFINLGYIKDYADFYHLDRYADEIKNLDGFGEKSVENILSAVEKSRKVSDRQFLYSLNIPICGQDVCKRLLDAYDLETLTETASRSKDNPEVFSGIDGIGPEKSAKFVEYFTDEKNYSAYKDLLKELDIIQSEKSQSGGKCEGITFVVTGDVYKFKNRNELKDYIESEGGKVTGSVTGKTDYLINNDVNSTSSKNQKAKQLGVKIIGEDEFIALFK